ncbi:MAG: hypothetical protein C4526_00865 [Nitrospiraceae bacterium]|nr:MAG: hypothetical protein C4526_00865 [Nitrospiraceae bacterium]
MIVKVAFSGSYVLKKTMNILKKNIFILLFSVYFLFYILSPLCLAEDGIPESSSDSFKTTLNAKNIRVIWEMVLSDFFSSSEDESGRANVHILIKKARALVSSNSIVKQTPSESSEFDCSDFAFTRGFYSLSDRYTKPEYRTGSYSSVSGLSPPFLS